VSTFDQSRLPPKHIIDAQAAKNRRPPWRAILPSLFHRTPGQLIGFMTSPSVTLMLHVALIQSNRCRPRHESSYKCLAESSSDGGANRNRWLRHTDSAPTTSSGESYSPGSSATRRYSEMAICEVGGRSPCPALTPDYRFSPLGRMGVFLFVPCQHPLNLRQQ